MIELNKVFNRKISSISSLLVIIVFIGILVRLTNLDSKSLWYDESLTWQQTRMPFLHLIKSVNIWDGAPFLFPFIIGLFSKFGDSELFLRFLPFIFGVLSIVAIYFLSKEFISRKSALISSLLVSLSSLQVAKSQDVRYYSLVMLLSILIYLFYFKYLKSKDIKYLLLLILFSLVFIFTYYASFIIFLSFNILFLFLIMQKDVKLPEIIHWGFAQIILLFGIFIIWNINLKYQIQRFTTGQLDFLSQGYPRIHNFIEYWNFSLTNTWKLFDYFYANNEKVAMLMLFLFFVGFVVLLKNRAKDKIVFLFIITVFLNIILAIFGKYPYVSSRHCIYLSPFYYLIIAAGFDSIFLSTAKTKFNKILFCIVLGLIIYTGLWNVRNYLVSPGETETRGLVSYLNNKAKADEKIYVYAAATYVFPYYYQGDPNICRFGRVWDNSENEAVMVAYEIDYNLRDVKKGWILSMMQDRLDLTMSVLLDKWLVNSIFSNEKGDVLLYHIIRKEKYE